MGRVIVTTVAAGAVLLAACAPAWAFQCPSLIKKIEDEAGMRLDDASYAAKLAAEQATALHKEGKHAEAVAKAQAALKSLGIN